MPDRDVDRLVTEARNGNVAAFETLYDMFAGRVFRFFRYRVANAETAEDLTQKVFLKMIEQLPNYRNMGLPFAAWLFSIARNTWVDDRRTDHPAAPLDDAVELASDQRGPEDRAADAYELDMVRQALARLTDDQREVIVCRFFAGLTPRETAAQMGRTEGSVRVLQHRALASLRGLLGPRLEPSEPGGAVR
jgi:RNA polymerase sigma-70 factor (ECF subfamily)